MYYLCWPLGFTISSVVYCLLCRLFPLDGLSEVDSHDVYGTFGDPELTEDGSPEGEGKLSSSPSSSHMGVVSLARRDIEAAVLGPGNKDICDTSTDSNRKDTKDKGLHPIVLAETMV